jgi:hypothetical protein
MHKHVGTLQLGRQGHTLHTTWLDGSSLELPTVTGDQVLLAGWQV